VINDFANDLRAENARRPEGTNFPAVERSRHTMALSRSVVLLPVTDLMFPPPFALIWRQDNVSALLTNFVADAKLLPITKLVRGEKP